MRLKPVRPKDVKNFVQSFKKPQTWFNLFQRLYPLGSGGLRTGYTPPEHDFLSDISVGYNYRSQDKPDFSQGGGAKQLTGYIPETVQKTGQPKKPRPPQQPDPELPPSLDPILEVPFPPEEIPPEIPYYEPDEDPNVDEELQLEDIPDPDEPRRPDPIIPVADCQTLELLTGIPCIASRGAEIQISTSKKNQLSKSKTNRKSSFRYYSRKKSKRRPSYYSRYYFSEF